MNPFKAHLEKKSRAITKQKAQKRAVKKGLVVDHFLLPELVLCVEYSDMRHDN